MDRPCYIYPKRIFRGEARLEEPEHSEHGSTRPDGRPQREPAGQFYKRLAKSSEADIDLEQVIAEHRKPHKGIDLR